MPYGRKQHIPPTNLLLLAAKQEPYKKKPISYRKIFWKKLSRIDQQAEKRLDRKSARTRQKNK